MKFSAVLSLGLAPVALAKAVHNVYPAGAAARRSPSKHSNAGSDSSDSSVALGSLGSSSLSSVEAALLASSGFAVGTLQNVIIIWVNGGGAATTTTVNAVSTVTQTITAGATNAAETTSAAAAATTTDAASTTVVATGAGATHTVTVGGPKGLVYEPDSITAAVGDMVIFTFLSQNHTATQSAFTTPCEALAGGMDSGFQANVNNSVNPPPQVAMQVMVDTPLWFYCRQSGHCGKGMTFSINPTANKTQALFQQMAIAQNGTGTDSGITGGTTTAVTSGTAATTTAATAEANSLTATLGATATSSTAAAAGTGVVVGTGTLNSDGSCACAVICAAGSFPTAAAQGLGAFGGMAGALPSTALATIK